MKRRQVLKGIAAGSAMSVGVAGASRPDPRVGDIEQYDAIHVRDGDEVVRTVENPTWDDVKRLENEATTSQQVVTPDGSCSTFCCDNCSCSDCVCSCSNCCDPSAEICSCCDCSTPGCEDTAQCS